MMRIRSITTAKASSVVTPAAAASMKPTSNDDAMKMTKTNKKTLTASIRKIIGLTFFLLMWYWNQRALSDVLQTTKSIQAAIEEQQQPQQQKDGTNEGFTTALSLLAAGTGAATTKTVAESTRHDSNNKTDNEPFRISCTARNNAIVYGSYKLRCEDFQYWTNQCAHNVEITTGVVFDDVLDEILQGVSSPRHQYDSTLIIKDIPSFINRVEFNHTAPSQLGHI
jgi:hypothetical protein